MGGRHVKPFLSVYGHVTVDQIMTVRRFPAVGTTEDVLTATTTLGGTGTNIALTAARLGCPTALCAMVGNDFPQAYEDEIRASGMIMDDFRRLEGYDSSKAIVVNDPSLDQKVLFYAGPQGEADKTGVMLDSMASQSEHVHFCTGQPSYYMSIMERIQGASIAMDPAQETHRIWNADNFPKALAMADALFCNRIEGESLSRYVGAEDIFDADVGLVVCTYGAEGSVARIGGEKVRIPAVKADRVVDVTGAGDSYRAGYYAALYRGYDAPEALVVAAAVASFTVEKIGALTNTPTWEAALERAEPYFKEIS
jgi:sugar/nucleoside kinase (ribokinase family)